MLILFQEAVDALNDKEFQKIRNACVNRAQGDERLYRSLQRASNSGRLFNKLAPHCNFLCIEFLETIAQVYSKDDSLINLIEHYRCDIFSKPLGEVLRFCPCNSVREKYYSELKATFDIDPDELTIEELHQKTPLVAKKIAMLITDVRKKCLLVSWQVPTCKVYQEYLSFLVVPEQSRKDSLVKFGSWTAYLPQCVLQEQQKRFG